MDVYLNLENNTHKPFTKKNYTPKYINTESNHPRNIIKHIPKTINDRLSRLSSNKDEFDKEKDIYQKQLEESGYTQKLEYKKPMRNRKKRSRNIIWFNPPYSNTVKTNVGKRFLKLIEDNFPEENPLHKIINKTSVKISYACTKNFDRIIKTHNNKILQQHAQTTEKRTCNCIKKEECPLNGECLSTEVIYEAKVKTKDTEKIYVGMTGDTFKTRYTNHKQSLTHEKYRNQTKLSAHFWEEKNKQKNPIVKFRKISNASKFRPGNKNCALCDTEKMEILIRTKSKKLLNSSNEVAAKCPHFRQYSLGSYLHKNTQEGIT